MASGRYTPEFLRNFETDQHVKLTVKSQRMFWELSRLKFHDETTPIFKFDPQMEGALDTVWESVRGNLAKKEYWQALDLLNQTLESTHIEDPEEKRQFESRILAIRGRVKEGLGQDGVADNDYSLFSSRRGEPGIIACYSVFISAAMDYAQAQLLRGYKIDGMMLRFGESLRGAGVVYKRLAALETDPKKIYKRLSNGDFYIEQGSRIIQETLGGGPILFIHPKDKVGMALVESLRRRAGHTTSLESGAGKIEILGNVENPKPQD